MKKNIAFVFGLVCAFSSVAMAADCSGNACGVAYVAKQRGCMVVINNGDRDVKFAAEELGYSLLVYGKTTEVLRTAEAAANKGTECVKSLGKHTINFN